ncbi:MAG TPA: PEGA domain-containing protein [Anaeromyxobacter sp.]
MPRNALVLLMILAASPAAAAEPADAGTNANPAAPSPATPPKHKSHRAIVPDFVLAGAAHPDLGRVLSDAAAQGANDAPDLQVLAQSEIVALLGVERTKVMLGCAEDACLSEVAGAADADRVLAGSLTLLERTALLTLRYVDAKKARTLGRTTATLLDATQAELVDAARRLAHEAVTGEKLDTTGTIRIRVDRNRAGVTLDGRSLGESPIASPQRVREGPHTVTIQKAGFVRWSTTIGVTAGREATVDADLVALQLLTEAPRSRLWTWGWASSGVAAAGIAGGLVFGSMAKSSHQKYEDATTRSDAVAYHDETAFRATLSNVSWGVGAVAGVTAVALLSVAMVQDARAAAADAATSGSKVPPAPPRTAPAAALVPLNGGAALAVAGTF